MGIEIERKFLVDKAKCKDSAKISSEIYRQGYMLTDPGKTIRIRLANNKGFITIKGISIKASRPEFEYEIPSKDAAELLNNFCTSQITKIRHKVYHGGKLWEVDEFLGDNEGLIIAEIELSNEEEQFNPPEWLAQEVTSETKYYNSNLSLFPYKKWHQ